MKRNNQITVENRLLQREDKVQGLSVSLIFHFSSCPCDFHVCTSLLPPFHPLTPYPSLPLSSSSLFWLSPLPLPLPPLSLFPPSPVSLSLLPLSLPPPSLSSLPLPSLSLSSSPSPPPPPPSLPQGRGWFGEDALLLSLPNLLQDTHTRPAILAYHPSRLVPIA